MTQYDCGYCDYDGDEQQIRGHLLGAHDVNAFDSSLWRHADRVEDGDTEGQTLDESMEQTEEEQNIDQVEENPRPAKKVLLRIKRIFN